MTHCDLCILAFNDIYELGDDLASLLTLINTERAAARERGEQCLLVVAGDFLSCGSSFGNVRQAKGADIVYILNQMKVDMVVCGNHELDFGPEGLAQAIRLSEFPWLGSNVGCEGCLFTKTVKVKGHKMGFFGLCTSHGVPPSHPTQMQDPVEVGRRAVDHLKEVQKVSCIIALTHLPLEDDEQLCRRTRGIDLILGGHDHHALSTEERGTHIIKAGCNGRYLTRVRVAVNEKGLCVREWSMLANVGYAKEPSLDRFIRSLCNNNNSGPPDRPPGEGLNVALTVAQTKGILLEEDLDSRFVREEQSSMATWIASNVLAYYQREGMKADLCMLHAGTVRGQRLYPKGHLFHEQDLKRELPYDTRLCLLEMSGNTLRNAIEQGVSFVQSAPMASYPHLSRGWTFDCDLRKERGHRLLSIHTPDGKNVDGSHHYFVILPVRLAQGSDGYLALQNASAVPGSERRIHEADHLHQRLDDSINK